VAQIPRMKRYASVSNTSITQTYERYIRLPNLFCNTHANQYPRILKMRLWNVSCITLNKKSAPNAETDLS
jgi:hypothetical protein